MRLIFFFYNASIFLTNVYVQTMFQVNTFLEAAVLISCLFLKPHSLTLTDPVEGGFECSFVNG